MKKSNCDEAKTYEQCPYVTAQSLLQGKWAILILHHLEDGPKRFGELMKKIKITQATLSTQLKRLEEEGLITRTLYPEVPPRVEYELTQIGEEFKPVLDSIGKWGDKYIAYLNSRE